MPWSLPERASWRLLALATVSLGVTLLGACAAIDFGTVLPPAIALAGKCAKSAAPLGRSVPTLLLPDPKTENQLTDQPILVEILSVQDFANRIQAAEQRLPGSLAGDEVVTALSEVFVKASVKGQIAGLLAADGKNFDNLKNFEDLKSLSNSEVSYLKTLKAWDDAANALPVPAKVTHHQMKVFVKTLLKSKTSMALDLESHRASLLMAADQSNLADYLYAYYNGKYSDIYGTNLDKPSIKMTISDDEINGLVSVFLDYLIDQFNVTLILGSDPKPKDGTTYYLGNNTVKPTLLNLSPSLYEQIPTTSTKCEWAADNVALLGTFANTAGGEAATLSGLVSQSVGGFEIGLGFLGKFSVGDNQTLSGIVKTAASRSANRAALAALFWAVELRHRQGG
jgi:hypothetical protein